MVSSARMKLPELLSAAALEAPAGLPPAEVTRVTEDSRAVVPGAVFVAVRGSRQDGVRFAGEAALKGAAAVVGAGPRPADLPRDVPWIEVADARLALARLAAAACSHPARKLVMTGVTGSKGKTSTSYLVQAIAEA